MPVAAGSRLGPYEVVSPLGAGGMGEVWRARDTKLNREVALKILPEAFALDADRLARFKREAQVLAALNHPHIGAIYGFEESNGIHALVLELVDGPTLADRIAHGPIPLDDALPIAKQIAEALEAAHEQGIIHRDLKPANVKLRADGTVKVLDFGLAKLIEADAGGSRPPGGAMTQSPTITTPAMTMAGMIFGTAAYMSPEQARGRRVDRRADIWAFGCVLFEMLAGKRVFDGEDVTEVIAAVVKSEPDWEALPGSVSGQVRLLLKRCLEKDPRMRIGEIGTVRFLLSETIPALVMTASAVEADQRAIAPHRRLRRIVGTGIVWLAIVGIAVFVTRALSRRDDRAPQLVRFAMVPPAAQPLSISGFDPDVAISPDGSHIVYRAIDRTAITTANRLSHLVVRAIGELDARPLPDTAGARFPFVSPDGRWVGFFLGAELKRVPISGGPPTTVCRLSRNPRGGSWGPDDTIVFATDDPATGLIRVPAGGGDQKVLTKPNVARGEDHWFPSFLPDGRAVLFTIVLADRMAIENRQVAIVDLKTGESKVLIPGASAATYTDSGHLIFAGATSLRAVPFDASRREVLGDQTPVSEQPLVGGTIGGADFAISRSGTLVYIPGTVASEVRRSLVWVDRRGREEPIAAPLRAYTLLRLSPDGTRVALDIRDQQNDIWVWDLARQTLTPLTFSPAADRNPVWTPDSRRIIFASTRDGALHLYWQAADGTGSVERLTTPTDGAGAGFFLLPMAVSGDGDGMRVLLNRGGDLAVLTIKASGVSASRPHAGGEKPAQGVASPSPAAESSRTTKVLFETPFTEDNAEISPDGRWLAYQSNESNPSQVYVRPFPNVDDGRWQVSTTGGVKPAWARNGRELFYVAPDHEFMAVPVMPATTTFLWGNPVKLFDAPYYYSAVNRTYDIGADGRFLMINDATPKDPSTTTPASLMVVLNWTEELKQRLPVK